MLGTELGASVRASSVPNHGPSLYVLSFDLKHKFFGFFFFLTALSDPDPYYGTVKGSLVPG